MRSKREKRESMCVCVCGASPYRNVGWGAVEKTFNDEEGGRKMQCM